MSCSVRFLSDLVLSVSSVEVCGFPQARVDAHGSREAVNHIKGLTGNVRVAQEESVTAAHQMK